MALKNPWRQLQNFVRSWYRLSDINLLDMSVPCKVFYIDSAELDCAESTSPGSFPFISLRHDSPVSTPPRIITLISFFFPMTPRCQWHCQVLILRNFRQHRDRPRGKNCKNQIRKSRCFREYMQKYCHKWRRNLFFYQSKISDSLHGNG